MADYSDDVIRVALKAYNEAADNDDYPPETWMRRALLAADTAMLARGWKRVRWLPISEARKDRTSYLLRFKNPIPDDREHVRQWDGLVFVGRHPGVCEDGLDIGWNFAAPVGHGGFPDEWIESFAMYDAAPEVKS